ncbi:MULTISPECIES: hypothetical protein [Serratia]|uniref:hypothetical protein n=1 Tax=Serratia TaxID=613 RepID=UPI000C173BD2|nr:MULTISPECIES: hypothetical protein [Serratia]ELI8814934.1 hypothetical protein [Serratia marcescens]ELI8817045.1 hypothetical protein [Serratia marcescens]ELI8843821.1 hypothetical protein [Serratia marcescens]MBE5257645.1 hypothetical protein [Serratia marcescens]MBE5300688.1 hypothetical protein [Serratia marcescens]
MYIDKVISYKHAWEIVSDKHMTELLEIQSALDDLLSENIESEMQAERISQREIWEKLLYKIGWELIDRTHYTAEGVRINVGRLGPTKNGLSVTLPFGGFDTISRWIFQQSTVAVKYGLIKTPVMLVPVRDLSRELGNTWLRRENFEMNLGQIEMLAPLSHQYPFLIIGYSNKKSICGPEIVEIASDSYVREDKSVIDRCIEFPSEYHQAGLDILNYFGTYLREQYPEENASVKIEQKGLTVRLVIETADGKSEIIEKALHEYELIITGTEPPEKFSNNDKLILELRNEIRIAKFRLESQQDFIGIQNNRIDQLLNIVGNGLSQKHQVMVDFKPTITLSNTITINQSVAAALSCVTELMEELPESSEAYSTLKELEGSLISIETDNDQESVRRSPAMSKFKRLIDRVTDTGSNLNSAIKKAEKGWEIFSDLATRYNKLAEWCGLPIVPSILLK